MSLKTGGRNDRMHTRALASFSSFMVLNLNCYIFRNAFNDGDKATKAGYTTQTQKMVDGYKKTLVVN